MKKRILLAVLSAALLGGCVVAPGPVYQEPPPPRVEYPGYAPVVGYVWIGGYWSWTGHRHEWVSGRWDAPRPGQRWVEPRWQRDGDRWHQHPGRWVPHERGPQVVPAPRPYYERRDERRSEPAPVYRQERNPAPQVVQPPPRREFEGRAPTPEASRNAPREAPSAAPRDGRQERDRSERREERKDDRRDERNRGRHGPDDSR